MSTGKLAQRGRIVAAIRPQQHSQHEDYHAEFLKRLVDEELAELAKEQAAKEAEAKERG